MSARVILKYALAEGADPWPIPWDDSSRVVHVGCQRPADTMPTLWIDQPYRTNDDESVGPATKRLFTILPTGTQHHAEDIGEFIGSAICYGGDLVWHVYAEATL